MNLKIKFFLRPMGRERPYVRCDPSRRRLLRASLFVGALNRWSREAGLTFPLNQVSRDVVAAFAMCDNARLFEHSGRRLGVDQLGTPQICHKTALPRL